MSTVTRTFGAPTSTSSSDFDTTTTTSSDSSSFVGNTPSTVLFFLAMAVGVAIACLFIFFTVRYFVRAKFGIHLYAASNRGLMFSPRVSSTVTPLAYTDREIQEHLEYLRTHHFLRNDFLERRLYAATGQRRRRRRRRRGRFARMKKLSPEEVEKLFPKCRYEDWLASGDDSASSMSVDVAKDGDSAAVASVLVASRSHSPTGPTSDFDVVEIHDSVELGVLSKDRSDALSSSTSSKAKHELHFDSGSCSICLDVFESDDIVRGLICGHVYHAECVDPWLTRRRACCPICKRDYYKEQSHSEGDAAGTVNIEERSLNDDAEGADAEGADAEGADADADGTAHIPDQDQASHEGAAAAADHHQSTEHSPQDATREVTIVESSGDDGRGVTPDTSSPARNENTSREERQRNNNRNNRDDMDELDYEVIRADSNIQALFNELVPLSERVRVLLSEHPELDMDARARVISNRKYGSFFKRVFWHMMGINKSDLYNWAVIKMYQEEVVSSNDSDVATVTNVQPQVDATPQTTETLEAVEMSEISTRVGSPAAETPGATSVDHNAEENPELAAARRESVESRA